MSNSSGKFKNVIGYITEAERVAIQSCVLVLSGVVGDALEIGSLNGLSALLTLSVLGSDKTLICIESGQVETLAQNLIANGLGDQAAIKNEDFNLTKLLPETKLCWIFIDHNHGYGDTIKAFYKFFPFLSSGGIIAFHDYQHPDFTGGTRAIAEISQSNSVEIFMTAGSFIAFKKK